MSRPQDIDPADRSRLELLRKASVARRAELALSLSQTVAELTRHALRRNHPEVSEREIRLKFVELHYGRRLAERVRAELKRRDGDGSGGR